MATGSINLNANLTLNTQSLNAASKQAQQALGRITGQASEFQKSLDASTARVFAFGATTSILNGVSQAFKTLVTNTIEVEKRIIEIGSILGGTTGELNALRGAIFSVAKDTGQAFGTVADAAAELARQGLSAEDTSKRLSAALVLTRVSGLDSVKSVKALTSAINGFTSAGLTAEQITNKLVAVDTKFAVSAQDLAEGFSRAGSTAEDAGVSFDELLGIITAVEQKTARGGAVIGNALKSIFARLSRSTTIDDLRELGVEIDSSQTGIQKLQSLSAALENVADPTVASKIKELAGGVFQINVVSAALKDLGSDTSIFAAAAKTAAGATNEAFTKNAQLNQSISSQINSLIIGLTNLSEKIGTITFGPILKNLLSLANTFSTFLEEAFDPEKGNKFIQGLFKTIGSFLAGPGLILITTAFLKIFTLVSKFAKEGFKTILDIGSQTEKIKNIEGGIVGLLARDQQLRAAIASTTATQAQKEAAVIAAIQRENALLTQQEQLLRSIATAAAQRGVGGYSQTGGFSGRGGRRFAAGYMEEEATAKMLGASPSVKAKQGKGTIGGQRFIMNNQETEIPNFGRNGDSAVIPHYARGFVPNYATYKIGEFEYSGAKMVAALKSGEVTAQQAQKAGYKTTINRKQTAESNILDSNLIIGKNTMPTILTPNFSGSTREILRKNIIPGKQIKFQFKAFGVDPSGKLGLRKEFDSYFGEDRIVKEATDSALRYARMAVEGVSEQPVDPTSINKVDNVKGFISAIKGAYGGIFDAALTTALRTNVGDDVGGDFDVNTGKSGRAKTNVRKLFGSRSLPLSGLADYKINAGDNTLDSMIKKTMASPMFSGKIYGAGKSKGKARGFIPNFNSVNKGIPVSQIRAHFDQSGNPIAVTNTRDEPNGLKDAIGREKQGIGMAAKGFIPNHARPAPPSPAATPDYSGFFGKTTAALLSLQLATNTLGDTQSEFNKKLNEAVSYLGILNTVIAILPEKAKGLLIGKAAGALGKLIPRGAIGTAGRAVAGAAGSAATAIGGVSNVGAALAAGGAAAGVVIASSFAAALAGAGVGYAVSKYLVMPILDELDAQREQVAQLQQEKNVVSTKIKLQGQGVDPNALINQSKSLGVDSKELQEAYDYAAGVLTNVTNISEKGRQKTLDRLTAAMNKQKEALAKEIAFNVADNKASFDARMQKEILAARLVDLNAGILNFKSIIDKVSTRLDQQKFAEGIAGNVKIPEKSPYAEATRSAIEIQQAKTSANQSKVGFMQNFAGPDFANMFDDAQKAKMIEKGKTGTEITGAISKEVFSAYMKDGAIGAGKALDDYLKDNLDPEDAKRFKDNVISSAETFRNNVAEAMQKALNRETEIQGSLTELVARIKEAGINFMTDAAGQIKELVAGPKIDPLALQDKFEEAAKLLKSGKKGDIEKGRDILASTSEDSKAFEGKFGKEKLNDMQRRAGLTEGDVGKAKGSAIIESTDFRGIEDAIKGSLRGVDQSQALKAVEAAKNDPTKIQNLIDTIKQTFGNYGSEKTRERGADIVNSLTGMGKVEQTAPRVEQFLEQNTLGGRAGMSSELKEAIDAFKKNMGDPKLLDDVKRELAKQYSGDPKLAEKAGKGFERAASEVNQPKITEDPAKIALTKEQEALNGELAILKTKIAELNTVFGDTGIPQAVTSLTNSVKSAATNLQAFTDFTINLNSLSTQVNGRLLDIEKKLATKDL